MASRRRKGLEDPLTGEEEDDLEAEELQESVRGNGDKEILESPNRVQSQHVLEK